LSKLGRPSSRSPVEDVDFQGSTLGGSFEEVRFSGQNMDGPSPVNRKCVSGIKYLPGFGKSEVRNPEAEPQSTPGATSLGNLCDLCGSAFGFRTSVTMNSPDVRAGLGSCLRRAVETEIGWPDAKLPGEVGKMTNRRPFVIRLPLSGKGLPIGGMAK
jgi:hypothetical protein